MVWWDESVMAYRARFPFNKQVVDFLKQAIPHSERSWDQDQKLWTFTEAYLDGTVKFFHIAFGTSEVAVVTKEQTEKARQKANTGVVRITGIDSQLVEFMKLIPYEAAKEAYRKAALLLHPDRGGDMEKMAKINALWTKIQKEIYGQ